MGYLTEKIGTKIYNAGVRRHNKLVRGEYHVKDKLRKGARVGAQYINAVGTNIVNDVTTNGPMPQKPKRQSKTQPKTRVIHHYYYGPKPKKRKRKQATVNPYPLI